MSQRILIVEDDRDNRQLLVWRVQKLGNFEIEEATNGREALEAIAARRPDLILMDLKMPELDGWETTRQIKASVGNVPVIAITAQAMLGDAEKALAAGCDAYISKPITDYAALADEILTRLAHGRPADALG